MKNRIQNYYQWGLEKEVLKLLKGYIEENKEAKERAIMKYEEEFNGYSVQIEEKIITEQSLFVIVNINDNSLFLNEQEVFV